MKFFKLIKADVDVSPFLEEVDANSSAWLLNTSRQSKIRVQRETNTIFLRAARNRPDLHGNENQESRPTEIAGRFPRALAFMENVGRALDSELSRATIVRLSPHGTVYPHIDVGSYYLIRDRLHLVLCSPSGSVLVAGDEQVRMQPGELWWFDNKQHHAAINESSDWRIHYIFDLLPKKHSHLAKNPIAPSDLIKRHALDETLSA
jgi:hypothetical protein